MLDTNICIYIIKHRPAEVRRKFEQVNRGSIVMSTITYGELIHGAAKSMESKAALSIIEELASEIAVLPLTPAVGKTYGSIRAQLEKKGTAIGNNDLWISAHAMSLKIRVVTNNVSEFSRVDGLRVENWVKQ